MYVYVVRPSSTVLLGGFVVSLVVVNAGLCRARLIGSDVILTAGKLTLASVELAIDLSLNINNKGPFSVS